MAMHYEHNCYTASTKKALDKVTPPEVIQYVTDHPSLRLGARLMAGEYKAAATVITHNDVASFVAFQILELYGDDVLEDFMTELGKVTSDDAEEGSPIAALQRVISEDEKSRGADEKHQVLGHVIKAFNSWQAGEQVKRITLKVNETFPRFTAPRQQAEAAE